ncbi:MAG: type II toxin-antitoxin system ParD family antitoxin [Bacteroidota bacterium]
MQSLNVTVTDEQKKLVSQVVAEGRYASASEVVRDSLRLFSEREMLREAKLQELRRLIEEGRTSGVSTPWDLDVFLAEARARREGES